MVPVEDGGEDELTSLEKFHCVVGALFKAPVSNVAVGVTVRLGEVDHWWMPFVMRWLTMRVNMSAA